MASGQNLKKNALGTPVLFASLSRISQYHPRSVARQEINIYAGRFISLSFYFFLSQEAAEEGGEGEREGDPSILTRNFREKKRDCRSPVSQIW